MWYGILFLIAIVTFGLSSLWWLSGWQGGSSGEAGPIGTTIAIILIAAGIMFGLGYIP
jgi:hypothetical protein